MRSSLDGAERNPGRGIFPDSTALHLGYVAASLHGFSVDALLPLDHVSALRNLLAQSGPQFFDRGTMPQHLEVLRRLLQQTVAYELQAGLDLYHQPLTLVHLLAEAEGEEQWRGL